MTCTPKMIMCFREGSFLRRIERKSKIICFQVRNIKTEVISFNFLRCVIYSYSFEKVTFHFTKQRYDNMNELSFLLLHLCM